MCVQQIIENCVCEKFATSSGHLLHLLVVLSLLRYT
nr:MAG TPA: hypothetical protein [Caudoviricetes sp.]